MMPREAYLAFILFQTTAEEKCHVTMAEAAHVCQVKPKAVWELVKRRDSSLAERPISAMRLFLKRERAFCLDREQRKAVIEVIGSLSREHVSFSPKTVAATAVNLISERFGGVCGKRRAGKLCFLCGAGNEPGGEKKRRSFPKSRTMKTGYICSTFHLSTTSLYRFRKFLSLT